MEHADRRGCSSDGKPRGLSEILPRETNERLSTESTGPRSGKGRFWDAYDILPCADGKARRVESGTFPLAHGVSARVGKLRAYGNAIVPQVAAEFVRAYMETMGHFL